MVAVLYKTHAVATGPGRAGKVSLIDGTFSGDLTVPSELGGASDKGLNPEKLFAMGYSACYMGALRHVAKTQNITISDDTKIEAEVGIGKREDGQGFGITVTLTVTIPGLEDAVKEQLSKDAHVVCPYSHALAHGVGVQTIVI